MAALAVLFALLPAAASADRQYSLRYGAVERGDVTMAANTIVSCPEGAPNCASARDGTGTVVRNSAWVMVPIDVDSDPSTFDSSSADLRIPAGATILYAGLYWGSDTLRMPEGSDAPNPSARGSVRLAAPDGAGYRPITASTVDSDRYYPSRYQGFADVTALVRSAGAGTYTVANVQASTGKDQYGGWGLVVAYRDVSKPVRWLGLYDGFREFGGNDPADIPITGFRTPATGTVEADFGMLTYEGDIGVSPDRTRLNGVDMSDEVHAPDNYWNARISEYGRLVTTKNPNYVNQLGMDANIMRADGKLANDATSAMVHMEVSTDLVMPGAMTLVSEQAASLPSTSAAPAVTGTARDGQTLTASNGTWNGTAPIAYAHQWLRCGPGGTGCVEIGGADEATYAAGAADVGSTLRVRVAASNVVGPATSTSDPTAVVAARPPVNNAAPTISGTARDGQTLTAANGGWTGTSIAYSYRWLRCDGAGAACAAISNATGSTYGLVPADVGRTIRVEVTGANSGGSVSSTSAQTAVVVARPPVNGSLPPVSGTARDGQTLNAGDGGWTGTPTITFGREWLRCDSGGAGCAVVGTAATYALAPADVGLTIRVRVTGTNSVGSATATSAPTAIVAAAPAVNTLAPTVTGTPRDGSVLGSTTGSWSGTPTVELARQWLRCDSAGAACVAVEDETGATYALTSRDVGRTIRMRVTGINGGGSSSADSLPSAVVAAAPPTSTGAPTVTGTARDGQTLGSTTGSWNGTPTIEFARRWLRCDSAGAGCIAIANATGASYSLVPADVGKTIRVEVTAANGGGSAVLTSAPTGVVAATPPVSGSAPAITGTARDGQTLNVTDDGWTGTPTVALTRQWLRCDGSDCTPIGGATGATYVLTPADVGRTIRVAVTGTNTAGSATATSDPSAVVASAPPLNTAAPTVTGTARDGLTLGSTTGGWTGTPAIELTRQWLRCDADGEGCVAIDGAGGAGYALGAGDVGHRIRLRVTGRNAGGDSAARSAPTALVAAEPPANTGAPAVDGIARDGQLLTARDGTWTGTAPVSHAHRWLSCDASGGACAPIAGATASTYELAPGDVGRTIRVEVTAANGGGAAAVTSAQTAAVQAGPPVNAALPVVSGTVRDGQMLSATNGDWSGTPAIVYTQQWRRCEPGGVECANVAGATGPTYALTAADVGRTIRVRVTATNGGGQRSADSQSTTTVAAIPPANSARPLVTGVAREGEKLTLSHGGWSGSTPLLFTYRWERCDSAGASCTAIAGATARSYTLTAADAGARVRGVVGAANPGGSGTARSDASDAVAAKPADPPPSDPPADQEPDPDPTPAPDPKPTPTPDPTPEPATLAATQWKSSTGTGLRLRLDTSAPITRTNFTVPTAMLPKRGDARRIVGRLTTYAIGARTWKLTYPRRGGVLLSGGGAPRVEIVRGIVRVSGLPTGARLVKLTLYTRDATSPQALVGEGRAADLGASARTTTGALVSAKHRLAPRP